MRIVHVVNQAGYGGTEKTACLLARWAQKQGHDAKVAIARSGEEEEGPRTSWARELLGSDNVWTSQVGEFFSLLHPLGSALGTFQQILEYQSDTDIVHLHLGHSVRDSFMQHAMAKAHRCRVVETQVFGDVSDGVDLTCWVSAESAAHRAPIIRQRGLPLTKFAILPNPVRPPHVLAKLDGLPEETLIVGSMGRPDDFIFEPTHLRALAVFMSRNPERKVLYLRMGCSALERQMLESLAIPHRIIEPTCSDGAISRFLNSLDCFLHSRRDGESDGMAIAEAIVHGVRVISHAGGTYKAHVAQLAEFSDFCRMVGAHDVVAYADAITEFADDGISKSIAAQTMPGKMLKKRGVDIIGERCLELYRGLLA